LNSESESINTRPDSIMVSLNLLSVKFSFGSNLTNFELVSGGFFILMLVDSIGYLINIESV